jgi:hypothetical protein
MRFLRSLLPCYVLHHLPSLIPNHFSLPSCLSLPPTSFLPLSLLVLPSLSFLPVPLYRLQFSFLSFPPSFAVSCLSSSSQAPASHLPSASLSATPSSSLPLPSLPRLILCSPLSSCVYHSPLFPPSFSVPILLPPTHPHLLLLFLFNATAAR